MSILTPDGIFHDNGSKIRFDEKLQAHAMAGEMLLPATDASRALIDAGIHTLLGRSGTVQAGNESRLLKSETPEISRLRDTITVPIEILALHKGKDPKSPERWLETLREKSRQTNIQIGRLFFPTSRYLSAKKVRSAIKKNWIRLPKNAEIRKDGVIEIPLSDLQYIISDRLLTSRNMAQVLEHGKHELFRIQDLSPIGRQEMISPYEFFVGAMHLSIGPYMGMIDQELNGDVFHLSARMLDGGRTTGMRYPRQIELYNKGQDAVSLDQLRVKIRLYPTTDEETRVVVTELLKKHGERVMEEGFDVGMTTEITNPEICVRLFEGITEKEEGEGKYGRILTKSGEISIPWERTQSFQNELTLSSLYQEQEKPSHLVLDQIVRGLRFVGGTQNRSGMHISHVLPDAETMRRLNTKGVSVFVSKGINGQEDAFSDTPNPEKPSQNIYFDAPGYKNLKELTDMGAKFYLYFNGTEKKPHVREFCKGFWVKPEAKEQFDKVRSVVAMFGSHVSGIDPLLHDPISKFVKDLKDLFGEELAICHGNGPGVMQISDDAAAEHDVMSIGVGIYAEKIGSKIVDGKLVGGQKPNYRPPVIANFTNDARHDRQKILDDISIFKIYNLGGAGTMEEAAISIVNTKIGEAMPAPHIFIDPTGNEQHLWENMKKQYEHMSAQQVASIGGEEVRYRLLNEWVPKFCHIARTYDEAVEIMRKYKEDPAGYWKECGIPKSQLQSSFRNAQATAKKTGIPLPDWLIQACETMNCEE